MGRCVFSQPVTFTAQAARSGDEDGDEDFLHDLHDIDWFQRPARPRKRKEAGTSPSSDDLGRQVVHPVDRELVEQELSSFQPHGRATDSYS